MHRHHTAMSQGRVLVTDGETRAAVATAWGLADAGFEVAIAASSDARPAPAHWSRAVSRRIAIPDPLTYEAHFLSSLEHLVSSESFSVLMPGSDASLLSVSRGRDRLE